MDTTAKEKPRDTPLAPPSSPAQPTLKSPVPPSEAVLSILERLKAKKKTLAPPATPGTSTSTPSTPIRREPKEDAKEDADKLRMSPPAKRQKTDDKAKVKSSANVFDSSSEELLSKSKSKSTKRKRAPKKHKSSAVVDSDSTDLLL